MNDPMFADPTQSIKQTPDHLNGRTVPGVVISVRKLLNVAAIRHKTGLSQVPFSRAIGVAVRTLQNWEQGRRRPGGSARVLLAMVEKNPEIVSELLSEAG